MKFWLALISFLGSIGWVYYQPDWESWLVLLSSFGTLISIESPLQIKIKKLILDAKTKPHIIMMAITSLILIFYLSMVEFLTYDIHGSVFYIKDQIKNPINEIIIILNDKYPIEVKNGEFNLKDIGLGENLKLIFQTNNQIFDVANTHINQIYEESGNDILLIKKDTIK